MSVSDRRRRRGGRYRRLAIAASVRGLHAIAEATQAAIMPDRIGKDHCVVSTKLLCDVLAQVNVQAVPLSCILSARNAACCCLFAQTERPSAEQLVAAGAAEVMIAAKRNGRYKPRHLIAAAKLDQWYLIDAAISQVARPERGIPDAGLLIEAIPQPALIEQGGSACFEAPCGAQLEYMIFPRVRRWYYKSPDWTWAGEAHEAYQSLILQRAREILEGIEPIVRRLAGE